MDSRSEPAGSTRHGDDIRPTLSLCDRCLRRGDYITCRAIADRAQIANPTHKGPVQILAICSVLAASESGTRPDWYSILHLPKFSQDETLIKENYCILEKLLNPAENPFAMAVNAHEWLTKAWIILSEPSMKALLDRDLRMEETGERKGETFWTRCPKCSYFYEYEKTFKDCLLRCQNLKCRVTFKAEQLSDSASPPAEVLNRKVYICYGFAPAGLERESEGGGKGGWRWWASPYLSGYNKSSNVIEEEEITNNVKGDGGFDVSDNVEQDKDEVKTEVESGGYSGDVNGEKEKVNFVEKENNGGGKIVKKRTKMMARTIKKIAGRGTRVNMKELFSEESDDVAGF